MQTVTQMLACASRCITRMSACALLLLSFWTTSAAHAQTLQPDNDQIEEEAPITITAPRIRMEEKSLAGTVTVITRSDIERTGAQNLIDLIIREPGIFVARKGQLGFGGNVRVRGLGGDPPTELLVTVNGHPNFMGIMGHILPAAYLLDNVERIEILRGPASALFGSMGMGGVINIVTRKPTEARQLLTKVDYGTYATKQAETSVSGTSGRWGYLLGWSSRVTDGSHPYAWFSSDGYSLAVENNLSRSLSAKLTVGAVLYSNLDQREVQDKINAGQTPVGLEQNFDRRDYDLTFDWTKDGAPVAMLKLYAARGDHNFQDGYHSKDYVRGIQSNVSVLSTSRSQATVGIDVQRYGGTIYSPKPLAARFGRTETAAFTTLRHDLGVRDHIGLGLRWMKPEEFGHYLLPQIGYWRNVSSEVTLRASARRGYRIPSFRELYLFKTNNPALQPERLWQYEVGINQRRPGGLELDLALFAARAQGLITLSPRIPPVPDMPALQWHNSPATTIKGVEASVRHRPTQGLRGYANFTVLDPGALRAGNMRRKLSLGLDWVHPQWRLYGDLTWVSGLYGFDAKNRLVRLRSFWVAQAKIVRPLRGGLEAYLVVDNLFNTSYRTDAAYPFPMPGRQVRVGLQNVLR